jgi:prepilin-type N-terminal cleavage/methylation domain-containing protein
MMHSKNLDGFTLIEVMLAVAIMATILTSIFISVGSIMSSVGSFSSHYQRLVHAKNYLIDARQHELENKKIGPQTIDYPQTTLTYQKERLSGTSAKSYKDVFKEKVLIEWTENNRKRTDSLISFVFAPEKKGGEKV